MGEGEIKFVKKQPEGLLCLIGNEMLNERTG